MTWSEAMNISWLSKFPAKFAVCFSFCFHSQDTTAGWITLKVHSWVLLLGLKQEDCVFSKNKAQRTDLHLDWLANSFLRKAKSYIESLGIGGLHCLLFDPAVIHHLPWVRHSLRCWLYWACWQLTEQFMYHHLSWASQFPLEVGFYNCTFSFDLLYNI